LARGDHGKFDIELLIVLVVLRRTTLKSVRVVSLRRITLSRPTCRSSRNASHTWNAALRLFSRSPTLMVVMKIKEDGSREWIYICLLDATPFSASGSPSSEQRSEPSNLRLGAVTMVNAYFPCRLPTMSCVLMYLWLPRSSMIVVVKFRLPLAPSNLNFPVNGARIFL